MNREDGSKWWALGALTMSTLAVGLDGTVLSLALPTLATALHASESDLQWFSSGYLLALAAAMLPAGLLGDRYGRKTVLLGSVALFGAGSAACAYAPSVGTFIVARALLGLAGAGVVVMNLAALTVLFSEEERPRAVGVWAGANFLALPLGPVLGGWLLTHYWWGWVFLINVPIALLGLVVGVALVPQSRARVSPGLDPVGVVGSTAGLVGLTYGLIEAGHNGWVSAAALVPMVTGIIVLIGFFAWERWLNMRPGGQPLLDMALFRSRSFTSSLLLLTTAGVVMIGVLFTLPQYFQAVQGTDAMGSGLRLLPLIAGVVAGAVLADRVAHRLGAKITMALGFALLSGASLAGASTGVESTVGFVAAWTAVFGAGLGVVFATAASAAILELPEERSGVGAALLQALQKVSGPFGAAVLGSVISSAYQARLSLDGLPPAAVRGIHDSVFVGVAVAHQLRSTALLESVRMAFVHGVDTALMVSAATAVMGIVLSLALLPGSPRSRAATGDELKGTQYAATS